MNSMMDKKDNFTFAGNCIEWCAKSGKRDRALFIEEGRVIPKFDVQLREIPLPPLPEIDELNQLLRGLEEENAHNRLLLGLLAGDEGESAFSRIRMWIFRAVLFLLTLVVVIYGWRRLRKAIYRREVTVPLVMHSVAQTVPAEALVEQRHQVVLHEGNLWEAAREEARQCFTDYASRFPHAPFPPPRIEARVGWWGRRALLRQVNRLWQLAYESPPGRITPAQFRRIADDAADVAAALASGGLVLQTPA